MIEPITAVAAAAGLIKTCASLATFVMDFIRATGTEGVEALQIDLDSLSIQLGAVATKCQEASGTSPSLNIEKHILEWIEVVLSRCKVMLVKLEGILHEFREYNDTMLGRFKSRIAQTLRSSDVQSLQDEMAKYRQYLHFYLTLVNGYILWCGPILLTE
jgi:hypothetical protein